jgi:pimeloyl-ACP methyl ester carboxylesterase
MQLLFSTGGEIAMTEKIVRSGGVELATEAFGDRVHPPVLLVMGAMASMLWWPDEFCERLAAQGRYVIRYDNRDTGLSTTYAPGNPPYTFDDMADDATRALDGYDLSAAHVAGMSMGGMIAQILALRHPARVKSLTTISTSPVGIDASHLPQTTEAYTKHSASGGEVDWTRRDQVVDFIVRDARMLAGTAFPHDAAQARRLIERDYDRARSFASATNHFMVKGGQDLRGRLGGLHAPLLVIHGTVDPIFPVEHGAALAKAVPGARLVWLEGGGHEINPGHWDEIIAEIVAHTEPRSLGRDFTASRSRRGTSASRS